ncbi:MAG TPA: ABC transporter permease subunit [Candidatus Binatia bacterium]|jgi:sulfate transport system permease protein
MSADSLVSPADAGPLRRGRTAQQDPAWVRWGLTAFVLALVGLLIVVPVVNIFVVAFGNGVGAYWNNLFGDADTRQAILLTATVVPIALGANTVFGIAAAWAIARFDFRGRTILTALVDLPFAVSPVVAGLMFVLIFGLQGCCGQFLREDGYSVMPYLVSALVAAAFALALLLLLPTGSRSRLGRRRALAAIAGGAIVFAVLLAVQLGLDLWPHGRSLKILFALPALVLATSFVTFPFVARELIPVLEALGPDEDLAAISLGATPGQMFRDVTLPNIRWGLVYGIILCNARAVGEFGAVYVVSGHIAGQTDTMPLRIEKLFEEYNMPGAFAVASTLTLLAIVTLVARSRLERKAPATSLGGVAGTVGARAAAKGAS